MKVTELGIRSTSSIQQHIIDSTLPTSSKPSILKSLWQLFPSIIRWSTDSSTPRSPVQQTGPGSSISPNLPRTQHHAIQNPSILVTDAIPSRQPPVDPAEANTSAMMDPIAPPIATLVQEQIPTEQRIHKDGTLYYTMSIPQHLEDYWRDELQQKINRQLRALVLECNHSKGIFLVKLQARARTETFGCDSLF